VSSHSERQPAKFTKSTRLLKRAEFERVYQNGRRHFSRNLTLFFLQRGEEKPGQLPRVGFTVSRAMGGAVTRNRIRRRMREAARLNLRALPPAVDIVINPKKSALTTQFAALADEVRHAFETVTRNASKGRSE
jgi:ribonuclease P protein component